MYKLHKESYLHMIHTVQSLGHLRRVLDCARDDLNQSDYDQVYEASRLISRGLIEAGRI